MSRPSDSGRTDCRTLTERTQREPGLLATRNFLGYPTLVSLAYPTASEIKQKGTGTCPQTPHPLLTHDSYRYVRGKKSISQVCLFLFLRVCFACLFLCLCVFSFKCAYPQNKKQLGWCACARDADAGGNTCPSRVPPFSPVSLAYIPGGLPATFAVVWHYDGTYLFTACERLKPLPS